MPDPRISQQSMGLGVVSSLEGVDGEVCWAGSGRLFGFGVPALLGFPMCSLTRKPSYLMSQMHGCLETQAQFLKSCGMSVSSPSFPGDQRQKLPVL